jgi:hypothetical protein
MYGKIVSSGRVNKRYLVLSQRATWTKPKTFGNLRKRRIEASQMIAVITLIAEKHGVITFQ